MSNRIFLLHSNCKIVKGTSRSLICDLQLRKMYPIPNSLTNLFTERHELPFEKVTDKLSEEDVTVFNEYIAFLADNELGFYCSEEERLQFSMLSNEWDFPAQISNCIIDSEKEIPFFTESLIEQFDRLGCCHIELRFYGVPAITHLHEVISLIALSKIQTIAFIVRDDGNEYYLAELPTISDDCAKIRSIIIYGAAEDAVLKGFSDGQGIVVTIANTLHSEKACGIIDQNFFQSNIPHYTESLVHNTCLNRKISIDADGNIKNCPSMKESYGNIRDTTLEEAINKPGFKKYWNITKDKISKCKDCEFRHVCTDCRAYLDDPDDIYSAPLKCGYDPYTCTWEEWSTNPLKQQAIVYYDMQSLNEHKPPETSR